MTVVPARAGRRVGDARRDSGRHDEGNKERQPPKSTTPFTLFRLFEEELYRVEEVRVMLGLD